MILVSDDSGNRLIRVSYRQYFEVAGGTQT